MSANEPTLTSKASGNSLDEIINSQKQLDDELQQLKNRYSRYSQLVSFQQEEEDFLLKNKEKVNSKRVSLSLKRKKDVTYGLMPHDDILEKEEEHEKQSVESADAFLNSIREKHNSLKMKDFELPPTPVSDKEEEQEEKVESDSKNSGKEPEKEMNRLCDLVQSLLSEAQDAIDSKPELNHPDIGKEEEEEDPEIVIPKRIQSLNGHRTSFSGLNDTSSIRNKHLSIMTDTTAIAQPLSPVSKRCGDGLDDYDDFGMSKFDGITSPYDASTPNDDYMKGPYPSKFYPPPPPEFYYGPPGYPPYFDPVYGPIPPYMWEEFQKQKMGLNTEESSSSEAAAAVAVNSRKENQEIIKTTTTTTTTTTEVKKDNKEVVQGKALVKKRRRHKHRRHIRPVDADGNLCESAACPVHTKSVVKKKQSSKLFKAQFGSDTQLFLSFFASFFVTSILVTISCLWSVIQVMAGNVNDKNLSRLLQSSSENAIKSNKKKIELILDKDSSESTESDYEEEDDEEEENCHIEEIDEDEEEEEEEGEESSSNKFITAPSTSDAEEEEQSLGEMISLPSKLQENNKTSNVNTHRRRNSF
ncbi:hypothetical protein PIROE2DRAFT_64263 [Piromyces sp. E2]|nr:hypothetical protein PIROE2DRAFT_64263 [Piromyces sp. E2]|eukprot:OUM58663.1 hypothetical protein PIROE2DRAFT_64263 [Piromyces sp. E2]